MKSAYPDASERSEGSTYRPIGEVAALLRLQPHVLRFWETKFKQIAPLKRSGGRRYYRREDVRLLFHIRDLLYVEGYTLRGAQKALRDRNKDRANQTSEETRSEPREDSAAPSQRLDSPRLNSPRLDSPRLALSPAVRADLERLTTRLEEALARCSEEDAQEGAQEDTQEEEARSGEQ